ncbi:MAG: SPFH domain-containing protein [Planctomycetes bacterium]|nr:SPFH domain-containing protein [Planctomycetota bacterium]
MSAFLQLIRDIVRGEADPVATAITLGILALVLFLFFCCRFVKEGEQAAMLRFGRFRRIVGPGFVIVGPPWRSLKRIHIRQTSLRLAAQSVLLQDGVVFKVVGVLVYRITDAYKALFEIANLQEAMGDVGAGKLREVVSGKTSDEMWDIQALRAAIMEGLRVQEEQWGVVMIDFLLVNVEPAGTAQHLFLLEELARRRVDAARITLEGFQKLSAEVGLPPRADSPLWAALAGMAVTAATFPDAVRREDRDGVLGPREERLGHASSLEEENRRLREEVELLKQGDG